MLCGGDGLGSDGVDTLASDFPRGLTKELEMPNSAASSSQTGLRAALAGALILCGSPGWSQSNEECIRLAGVLLSVHQYEGSESTRTVQKAALCTEEYSKASNSQKTAIAGGYSGIEAEGEQSAAKFEEAQKKHCEGKYGDYWKNLAIKQFSVNAPAEALKTVELCMRLRAAGLKLTMNALSDGRQYTVIGAWGPSPPSDIKVAYFGPTDAAQVNQCTITMDGTSQLVQDRKQLTGLTLKDDSALSLTCNRTEEVLPTRDGIQHSCYGETAFLIHTDGPQEVFTIPRRCSERITPESRAAVMQADIARLQSENTKAQEELAAAKKSHDEARVAAAQSLARLQTERDARPRLKIGNNGTASCDQFCAGSDWGDAQNNKFSAACIIGYRTDWKTGVHCGYLDGENRHPLGWGYNCVCEGK